MANGNLSPRQFTGNPNPTVSELAPSRPTQLPKPITEPVKPRHTDFHFADEGSHPLPLSSQTLGSAQNASTWRKPNRVLPYSAATMGSTFRPDAILST